MADVQVNIKSDISDVEKDVIKLSRELRDAKLAMKDLDKTTEEYAKQKQNIDQLSIALTKQKDTLQDLRFETKKTADGFTDAKEKMGDLKDEAVTLSGSGIERLKGSFGLFKEGLENADFGKVKTAFKGLGAAMKAVPIFLIVEGIMKLIESFDELKESGGLVGKVFTAIGEAIDWVSGKIELFTDWIQDVDTASKKLAENQIASAKATQQAVSDRYDTEIRMANAAGQNTTILEINKVRAVRESVDKQIEALEELDEIKGGLSGAEEKQLAELKKTRSKSIDDETVMRTKQYKDLVDGLVKHNEEIRQKNKAAADKRKKDLEDSQKLFDQVLAEEIQKQNNRTESELKDQHALKEQRLKSTQELQDAQIKANEEVAASYQAADDLKKKLQEEDLKRQEEAMYKSIDAAKAIADVFMQVGQTKFNEERNNIQRQLQNEALSNEEKYALQLDLFNKERELKRKQFDINKAFNVVQAIQDGIRSVSGALANTGTLGPGAIALAAVNATIAAANVAKILATKFDGGVAPAFKPNAVSTGGAGGNGNPSQQQLPQNQASNPQGTNFDAQGNKIEQRVYVLEEDITDTQRNIARVNEQRKF